MMSRERWILTDYTEHDNMHKDCFGKEVVPN